MADTVKALWVAGFEASLPDGTPLIPNETEANIPAGEAKASANWKPVGGTKPSVPSKDGDE